MENYCNHTVGVKSLAVASDRYKFYVKIGSVTYPLPIYTDYSSFYNGKYLALQSGGTNYYVPLSPSKSELTINAGVYKNDTLYYYLTEAFEKTAGVSGGYYFKYISGESNEMDLTNAISLDIKVPESGYYNCGFRICTALGYNSYKGGYRAESQYQFQVRHNGDILADTGLHNVCAEGDFATDYGTYKSFYSYAFGIGNSDSSEAKKQWYDLLKYKVYLTAGKNTFQLWIKMSEHNNKHACCYVKPFEVTVEKC